MRCSRTKAPSLHRRYPASPVLRASPPPCSARPDPRGLSVGACHATGRASRVASIPLFHTCCRHYPGGTRSVLSSLASRPLPAFPVLRAGRLPHHFVSRPARRSLALQPAWSLSRPRRPVSSECFERCRYLHHPLRLLPAGATVAGRDSHPLGNGALSRRTVAAVIGRPPRVPPRPRIATVTPVELDATYRHTAILEAGQRPFRMRSALLEAWRQTVSETDTLVCLGDVAVGPCVDELDAALAELPGRKVLVPGNHDFPRRAGRLREMSTATCTGIAGRLGRQGRCRKRDLLVNEPGLVCRTCLCPWPPRPRTGILASLHLLTPPSTRGRSHTVLSS